MTNNRAFADQFFGDPDKHMEVRKRCVDFMEDNSDDFAPFIDDSITFDKVT